MSFTGLLRARLVWMNIVVLMLWVPSTGSILLIGQSHSTVEELTMRVHMSDTTVLPLEPLWIRIIISNDTHKTIKHTTSWQIFRWIDEEKSWKPYHPEYEPYQEPIQPYEIAFQPGESKSWLTYFDYMQGSGRHVFSQPGTQQIRVAVGDLTAQPITITVVKPDGEDFKAYKFLEGTKLAAYFNEASLKRYGYTQETLRDLLEVARMFPMSKYAFYAKIGAALVGLRSVQGKVSPERSVKLLREVAQNSDESLASRAYYYLGKASEEQGDLMDAHQYYSRALSLKADPYIEFVAKEAQTNLEPRLSPPKTRRPRR
jgi:tetratricopeptide (TPR) repeat protein